MATLNKKEWPFLYKVTKFSLAVDLSFKHCYDLSHFEDIKKSVFLSVLIFLYRKGKHVLANARRDDPEIPSLLPS